MNAALVVASCLIVAVGAAHSFLGERYILIPLFRRSDLPRMFGSDDFTRRTLRLAWHLTSVVWCGVAALLVAAARAGAVLPVSQVGAIVATTSFASAVVAFLWSRGRHLSWLAFSIIGALSWLGTH